MPNSTLKQDGVYSINYNSESHVSVIFQRAGSVWHKVLPYCIVNALVAMVIQILRNRYGIDLSIVDKGHSMMTLFVSFLVVSRVGISLGRYNESRSHLGVMYREARELVQNMVVFTKADQSERAKECRNELAYAVSTLLRLAMCVIDYPETGVPCWKMIALKGETKDYILGNLKVSEEIRDSSEEHIAETNMRVPIQMSYHIRDLIYSINKSMDENGAITAWEFGRLFGSIDSFMGGYYGIRKFVTTPFPFPLVQMARTFLFIYLFTLPFALLDTVNDSIGVHMVIVFLVTFGFVGLETVSIELDNPFGADDNDFDNMGMAGTALQDTYLTIYNADGEEWMHKLKDQLTAKPKMYNDNEYHPNEKSALMV